MRKQVEEENFSAGHTLTCRQDRQDSRASAAQEEAMAPPPQATARCHMDFGAVLPLHRRHLKMLMMSVDGGTSTEGGVTGNGAGLSHREGGGGCPHHAGWHCSPAAVHGQCHDNISRASGHSKLRSAITWHQVYIYTVCRVMAGSGEPCYPSHNTQH